MSASVTPEQTEIELSVIVPCYNEELNVPELTERVLGVLDAGGVRGELVLVDDGSADRTPAVIEAQTARFGSCVRGVLHEKNRGMAAAWRSGVEAARGHHIALIDADLQYQPEDILKLYRALLESGVDVTQGWRSSVGRLRDGRYVLSRGLNTLLNGSFGMHLKDNKSGFVCCAREVMLDLLRYEGHYSYWQSFLMVAAHTKGYSYREMETLFEERRQGKSFLDGHAYRAAFKNFVDVGRAFWEYKIKGVPADGDRSFLNRHNAAVPTCRPSESLRVRADIASCDGELAPRIRNAERMYEVLLATERLSPAQIVELQDEKLRRLVRHAYRAVPYYRARMQALRLRPEDVRSTADLHKLPFLEKDELRKHLHFDILKEGIRHAELVRLSTSGSTGEPLVFYADRLQLEFRWAVRARARSWAGHALGDPLFELDVKGERGAPASLMNRVLASASGRARISAVSLDEAFRHGFRERLRSEAPVLVQASAELLEDLAQDELTSPRLRGVISNGGTLESAARERIQRAFGCPVFDHYTSREFALIAAESDAHDGHLVAAEGYAVEVLVGERPAEPGELGDVVVTDLNSYSLPFIRYRTGDRARAIAPASAGNRNLPRIGEIVGRRPYLLRGRAGTSVPSEFFSDLLAEYDFAIRRFRFEQPDAGAVRVLIVRARRYSDDVGQEIVARARREVRDSLDVELVVEQ